MLNDLYSQWQSFLGETAIKDDITLLLLHNSSFRDEALLNLEKAKNFAPEMVQVYTAFAHYYETVGEPELTVESYEKALSLKSDDADTLNNYGVYLCRQGEIEAAEKQFLKAIEDEYLDDNDGDLYTVFGSSCRDYSHNRFNDAPGQEMVYRCVKTEFEWHGNSGSDVCVEWGWVAK